LAFIGKSPKVHMLSSFAIIATYFSKSRTFPSHAFK
jgi:hypothetical protein